MFGQVIYIFLYAYLSWAKRRAEKMIQEAEGSPWLLEKEPGKSTY
jgi:hypothetical protein